jgi:hypothetical protein
VDVVVDVDVIVNGINPILTVESSRETREFRVSRPAVKGISPAVVSAVSFVVECFGQEDNRNFFGSPRSSGLHWRRWYTDTLRESACNKLGGA